MKEYIYLNGTYVLKDEAKISVFDRGFLYGDGLFETMRSYDGKVFKLKEHLARLFSSLYELDIKTQISKAQLEDAVYEILEVNNLKDAYIRLTVSRGVDEESTVVIFARYFSPYSDLLYREGMKTIIVKAKRDQHSKIVKHKTLNFLSNLTARTEAAEAGVDEGIFLNYNDDIVEGTVSNIFIVINKVLTTPALEDGILPGITRMIVIKLAKELSLEVEERSIKKEEIFTADECFLTNSLMEVMPVTSVNFQKIGKGCVGEVTELLSAGYKRLVNEC
ncbi:MAG: aminotransferase class IV [Actinobacteria bacterium]|nr:aminotransferase class IV [Actinomycetota bacterium]